MKKDCLPALLCGLALGLAAGVVLTLLATGFLVPRNGAAEPPAPSVSAEAAPAHSPETAPSPAPTAAPEAAGTPDGWDPSAVYTGGDSVVYEGRIYRARWWTQGETPGRSDVWEDTLASPAAPAITPAPPAPTRSPGGTPAPEGFKVVGYFPSWKPEAADALRYDVLTHVIYAFAIPTADGGLRPLEHPETARAILRDAHADGVQVLVAVGGWSYNDTPLEATFVSATGTQAGRAALVRAIVSLCEDYGFDGVDMDWEHPRVDGPSAGQYEGLMGALAGELHRRDKVLTSAVLSGATADGNVYYDAAAHSDAVLEAVDWIHVMAYDGGDGPRHSPYDFAVRSAEYWRDTRGVPAEQVVLGVPFYARPSWVGYGDILAAVPDAWRGDTALYQGMEVWYNGPDTARDKTRYALEGLGGVMIWEVTQDTADRDRSLLSAIGAELGAGQ